MICDALAWCLNDDSQMGFVLLPEGGPLDPIIAATAMAGSPDRTGYLAVLCPGQIWLDIPYPEGYD